jgi:fructose-bisphosphate aldolase class II
MSGHAHIKFFAKRRKPLPGDILFDALYSSDTIVLAVNPRLTIDVIAGILQAAKDSGQIVILELALSEMNVSGGYTGSTPLSFASRVREAADIVGWYGYVLHADHLTVKKGTAEEMANIKKEIDARVDADFSSFAVDSSFLFNREAQNIKEQLKEVIRTSVTLFDYIKERMGNKRYGREGEVGEIGIKDLTEVEEALHFLNELREKGVELNCLAIANGSKHGVSVDEEGNIIPQLGINIQRTVEIADAIRDRGHRTAIAQHGITGTPLSLISSKFPKGRIIKGNVGTFWMLLVWDILQIFEPFLYKKIFNWVASRYGEEGVSEHESFISKSKYAIKEFYQEIDEIHERTKRAIRAKAYTETLIFFEAFGMKNTAEEVYDYIIKNNIEY